MTDPNPTQYEALASDIAAWLDEQRTDAHADRFVVGLSGGIDSATVCGLCVRAAGADHVTGVIMPSDSNPLDAEHAALVAATFGVETVTVDLTGTTSTLLSAIESGVEAAIAGSGPEITNERRHLAVANVRPRLRMTTLYYLANLKNGIVVGTGNKSEAMIGYFTKYGDGGVDLLPIVDLYKHEVRELARTLGVPEAIVSKAPSAGLWPGQTDEAEIGLLYDELDAALIAIESGQADRLPPEVRERVFDMINTSHHKRQPIPSYRRDQPVPVMST